MSVSAALGEARSGSLHICTFIQLFLILPLSVSRLAGMDQEIHKLMVGHYTVDVKLSQVMERLTTMDGTPLTPPVLSIIPSFSSPAFIIQQHLTRPVTKSVTV